VINRTHVWFAAFVLIVFGAGLATGVAVDRRVWHGGRLFGGPGGALGPGGFRGSDRGPGGGPGGPGRSGDRPPTEAFIRELDTELTLSDSQKKTITDIVNASRPEVRALQEEASKKFAEQQKSLHDEIVKVLTPEQAKKFEEMPRGPFGFRSRGGGRGGR
jgi:hypothetical protein